MHRFLTKDCTGTVRVPRGTLTIKTHKRVAPHEDPPAQSRFILDTTAYPTTPLATFLSHYLRAPCAAIEGQLHNTQDFVRLIESKELPQTVTLITMDVEKFFPNTVVDPNGENVLRTYMPPELRDLSIRMSRLIHNTLYLLTPIGLYKIPGTCGIGMDYSREVCDLDRATVEQRVLRAFSHSVRICIALWGRLVDDYFFALTGSEAEKQEIINAFATADPKRPLTLDRSEKEIDFLDVTVFKGHRFRTTGVLDLKLFTKPSYSGLHLPYTSHHPPGTFKSLLRNEHNRSIINHSSRTAHSSYMHLKHKEFQSRCYTKELTAEMLLQETTRKEGHFQAERKRLLTETIADEVERPVGVLPLKIPYTPRTEKLQCDKRLKLLSDDISQANPALSRVSLGRFVLCNLKTAAIQDKIRPNAYSSHYLPTDVWD